MGSSDWFVVVNPSAGRGNDLAARTEDALREHSLPAAVHVSDSPDDLTRLVDIAVRSGRNRFVAVGGDGTLNLVVNALMRHSWSDPPVLGILPGGSGCDFVRVFGISQQLERAAKHLAGSETYRCDLGYLEGDWGDRFFINIAQAGIGAASAVTAKRLGRFGAMRYRTAFWLNLPRFKRTRVRLQVGDRFFEGEAVDVIFANGQFFGGGMNIAPKATLTSGEADIQVFTARKREAPLLMRKAGRGLHLNHPQVRRLHGSSWSLETEDPWPLEADGEYLGKGPLRGRIIPAAIDIKI